MRVPKAKMTERVLRKKFFGFETELALLSTDEHGLYEVAVTNPGEIEQLRLDNLRYRVLYGLRQFDLVKHGDRLATLLANIAITTITKAELRELCMLLADCSIADFLVLRHSFNIQQSPGVLLTRFHDVREILKMRPNPHYIVAISLLTAAAMSQRKFNPLSR